LASLAVQVAERARAVLHPPLGVQHHQQQVVGQLESHGAGTAIGGQVVGRGKVLTNIRLLAQQVLIAVAPAFVPVVVATQKDDAPGVVAQGGQLHIQAALRGRPAGSIFGRQTGRVDVVAQQHDGAGGVGFAQPALEQVEHGVGAVGGHGT
jgi:hypothetical protein